MKENEDVTIKNNKGRVSFSPRIIGLSVLVLVLVMVLAAGISAMTGEKLTDIGSNKGSVALYDSLPDSIRNIEGFSSGIVMLTDTAVDYLSSDGKRIASNAHLYSQPVMLNNGNTVFVYDKGGSEYRIEKKTAVYNNFDVNGTIITAALGKNSNYAFVLNEDSGYQSHLFVYSSNGKKKFEWGSKSDYCIKIALSDNGKSAAAAVLGVENGVYYSKLHFFDFNSDEVRYTAVFEDITVFDIEYLNNKEIVVWTDNGIFRLDKEGNKTAVSEYFASALRHSSTTRNGLKVLGIARHGNDNNSRISVFNKKYKELYSRDFTSDISGVEADKKYVAVMLEDSVNIFDSRNNPVSTINLGERCIDAAISGSYFYVHTVSGIYVFSVGRDYDLPSEKAQAEDVEATFSEEVTFVEDEPLVTAAPESGTDNENGETMISYG